MSGRIDRRRFLGRTAAVGVLTGAAGAVAASRALAGTVPADEAPAPAPVAPRPALTVLVYHSIPGRDAFALELDWLQAWNYSFVGPDRVADFLAGRADLPPKALYLTFDDGYRSQYEYAWPELERRGVAATLFACTGWVDGRVSRREGDFREAAPITWAQLRTMQRSGLVSVQSHTVSHDDQTRIGPARVRSEFLGSKARIEEMVPGQEVAHLAYPFGAWSLEVRQALADAGCRTARTMTLPGPGYGFFCFADAGSDPLSLPCAGGSFHDVMAANFYRSVVPGDELCPDYGFEAGGIGWRLGPGFSVADLPYGAGRRSLQAEARADASSSRTVQLIPVVAGSTLSGAVAMQAVGLDPGAEVAVACEIVARDGRTSLGTERVAVISGALPGWTQRNWSLHLGADAAFIRLHCLLDPAGVPAGRAYWDDLSVRAAAPDPRLAG